MPPSPIQGYDSPASPSETDEDSASESPGGGSRTGPDGVITFEPLPKQSIRTALILDRFSKDCPIHYCSNDSFLSTTHIMGRPFFDFVARRDEALVRSWIDAVKGWGVNERGQPSDGGFGFGKFHLYPRGRDSVYAVSFCSCSPPDGQQLYVFLYISPSVSEWSQSPRKRNRAMGAQVSAVAQVASSRIHRGPSHIPPRQRRCGHGNIGPALRRVSRKTRLS